MTPFAKLLAVILVACVFSFYATDAAIRSHHPCHCAKGRGAAFRSAGDVPADGVGSCSTRTFGPVADSPCATNGTGAKKTAGIDPFKSIYFQAFSQSAGRRMEPTPSGKEDCHSRNDIPADPGSTGGSICLVAEATGSAYPTESFVNSWRAQSDAPSHPAGGVA